MGTVTRIFDGLVNALTGAGSSTDPRSYNHYAAVRSLSPQEIDAAYRGGWTMRKIIDKPATEMVREWRDWQADAATIEKLEAAEKALDLRNKVRRAEVLRGLGGAGIVLWLDDADQEREINPAAIRAGGLKAVHVWHHSRFTLGPMIVEWGHPWFGHPSYYEVHLSGGGASSATRFHPSRVIAFKGDPVPDISTATWSQAFWGDSKVQTVLDAVQNSDTAQNGFAALIKDARNRRIGVPKLFEKVATAAGEAQLGKRAQAFAIGESMFGVSFYDAGDGEGKGAESIDDRQMVWAGIPDIANMYLAAAAGAADMPATILLGKSPDGMNATGASDLAIWQKTIKARQDLDLRPCLDQLDTVLIPSALGKPDASVWYQFAPLSTPTEAEEAATFDKTMDAVTKLLATNAIPTIAAEKGLQNLMSERGWVPGLDDALREMGDDERFPSLSQPDAGEDPSALAAGDDPAMIARRAANDGKSGAEA